MITVPVLADTTTRDGAAPGCAAKLWSADTKATGLGEDSGAELLQRPHRWGWPCRAKVALIRSAM